MDDGAPLLETFTSAVSEANLPHDAGAFFPHARHFTISGGTYTSHVTQVAPTVRHDFRMIPLGDLDLLHEIRLEDGPGVITRRRSTGKIYHVHLDGRASTMTAVVYQGKEGEQAWCRELQTYSGIRHPNIVQIYGVINSSGLYATIFHDEFISFDRYVDDLTQYSFEEAPITGLYLLYRACYEVKDAVDYLASQGASLEELLITLWIRQSTGGVTIEIPNKGGEEFRDDTPEFPIHYIPHHRARLGTNSDSIIISSLDFQDFYDLLAVIRDDTFFYVDPGDRAVQLGAFVRIPAWNHEFDQLAWVSNRKLLDDGWHCGQRRGIPMENGWTRFESSEISDLSVSRCLRFIGNSSEHRVWLSQANHILSHLQITDDYEEYGLVTGIEFTLHFPQSLPNGYLFLCPLEDFQTSESLFQRAEAYAYWSPDPSGSPRLSPGESVDCGFSAPQLRIRLSVRSWGSYPYDALRQFHLAKDFDPDSQDVAIHLGYPLYQIRARPEPLFAHVEEHSSADKKSLDSDDGYLQPVEDDSQKTNITAAETHPTPPQFSNSTILTMLGIVGVHVLCRSLLRA